MQRPVRILSPDLTLLGEMDGYKSMMFSLSDSKIGEFELRVNRNLPFGNVIDIDTYLHVDSDKIFWIKHKEITLSEDGKGSEEWLYKGFELKKLVDTRIIIPPEGFNQDMIEGSYETVMKHYIDTQLVNPVDINRKIPKLIIAPDMGRGDVINTGGRFQNVAEFITNLSLVSGLGWKISVDLTNQQLVFDVYESDDKTVDQSTLPPVIFSPQFESVKTMDYCKSELNYKNVAYVAGQGEGTDRIITTVGTDSGLRRNEVFIDARDVPDETEEEPPAPRPPSEIIAELTERGQQQLTELMQDEYLECQLLTPITRVERTIEGQVKTQVYSPFIYEIDYKLGDIVTIQNRDWNVTLNAKITEVKEIYDSNGFTLEATFGNNRPTLIQKIKQELSQMSGEIRK